MLRRLADVAASRAWSGVSGLRRFEGTRDQLHAGFDQRYRRLRRIQDLVIVDKAGRIHDAQCHLVGFPGFQQRWRFPYPACWLLAGGG